jgi:putative ABC transport system ATP-binding protein
MNSQPVIVSAERVHYSYGATPALRGASVRIRAGELVAITGPSGSGKSTLLLCLAGILRPDAGEVQYGARQLGRLSEARRAVLRRTEFGVLFQFGQLVPELTAAENVALPLLLDGKRRGEAMTVARQWLTRLDVGELGARRPGELSGGQQQRVAVAKAMVTGPRVLFADEPTGALDALASEQMLAMLVRTARESGMTVVLVTHDAQVAAYADRELVVRDGVVESAGGAALTVPSGVHAVGYGG